MSGNNANGAVRKPSTIDVGQIIDDSRLNRVSISVILLCGLIMLMDGYDYTIITVAAPVIMKEWNVGTDFLAGYFPLLFWDICSARLFSAPSRIGSGEKRHSSSRRAFSASEPCWLTFPFPAEPDSHTHIHRLRHRRRGSLRDHADQRILPFKGEREIRIRHVFRLSDRHRPRRIPRRCCCCSTSAGAGCLSSASWLPYWRSSSFGLSCRNPPVGFQPEIKTKSRKQASLK